MNDFLTLHLYEEKEEILINKNHIVTICEYENIYNKRQTDIATIKDEIISVTESINEIKQMLCIN